MDSATRASILIDGDTVVTLVPDVVTCALGEGTALLDLRSSNYFDLNPVASFIWERLAEPRSVATLIADVRESFAADEADVAADMIAIIAALAAADLVAVTNAPPRHAPA